MEHFEVLSFELHKILGTPQVEECDQHQWEDVPVAFSSNGYPELGTITVTPETLQVTCGEYDFPLVFDLRKASEHAVAHIIKIVANAAEDYLRREEQQADEEYFDRWHTENDAYLSRHI